MELIALTINVPEEKTLNLFEITELREKMSVKLDKALRQAGLGKWVGGRGSTGAIIILLQVKGCEAATNSITAALEGHWLLNHLKISRYGHPEETRKPAPP